MTDVRVEEFKTEMAAQISGINGSIAKVLSSKRRGEPQADAFASKELRAFVKAYEIRRTGLKEAPEGSDAAEEAATELTHSAHRVFRRAAQNPAELEVMSNVFSDFYEIPISRYCIDPVNGGNTDMEDGIGGLMSSISLMSHHWRRKHMALADVSADDWQRALSDYFGALADYSDAQADLNSAYERLDLEAGMPDALGGDLLFSEDEITSHPGLSFDEKLKQVAIFREWRPRYEAKQIELRIGEVCDRWAKLRGLAEETQATLMRTPAPDATALATKLTVLIGHILDQRLSTPLTAQDLEEMVTDRQMENWGPVYLLQDSIRLCGTSDHDALAVKPWDPKPWIDSILAQGPGWFIDRQDGSPVFCDPNRSLSCGPAWPQDGRKAFKELPEWKRAAVKRAAGDTPNLAAICSVLCGVHTWANQPDHLEAQLNDQLAQHNATPEEEAIVRADIERFGWSGNPTDAMAPARPVAVLV